MSFIVGTSTTGKGMTSGEFWEITPDWSAARKIYLPHSVGAIERRTPTGGNMGKRQYIVGGHTANLVIDEQHRCLRQGMRAPLSGPTVTAGGGSNVQIGYQRFYDQVTGERSPLSEGTEFTGSVSRVWSNLPTEVPGDSALLDGVCTIVAGVITTVPPNGWENLRPGDRVAISTALNRWARIRDVTTKTLDDTGIAGVGVSLVAKIQSRASHVETWVSVDGSLPRLVIRVPIGTTTVTESTATLALGEAETESFTDMPYGAGCVLYNQRQIIFGVEGHLDKLFLSIFGFPERYGGLSFTTEYNEPIVGAVVYRKFVVVNCPESSYVLQGLTDDDYTLEPLDADIGGIGPMIVRKGILYSVGREAPMLFNGAWHNAAPTRTSEWTNKSDQAYARLAYETGFWATNPNDKTVQFYPNYPWLPTAADIAGSPQDHPVWIAHYDVVSPSPDGGVSTPEWLSDSQLAPDGNYISAAAYLVPVGAKTGRFYRATSSGKIYEEDESGASAFHGTPTIALRHEMFGAVGGNQEEANELIRMWSMVLAEYTGYTIEVWPGDEYAYPHPDRALLRPPYDPVLAPWSESVAAGLLETDLHLTSIGSDGGTVYAPVVTHPHANVGLQARGFTIVLKFLQAKGVIVIAVGGIQKPRGEAARVPVALADEEGA